MKVILRNNISNWTNDIGLSMPTIPKGSEIIVKRILDRSRGWPTEYLGTISFYGKIYHFEVERHEFDIIM